jgi:4-amino-4-deoxy-L-arabinose transferase-like glycosyltransferase
MPSFSTHDSKLTPLSVLILFLFGYLIIWGGLPSLLLSSVYPDSAENLSLSHTLAWSYSKHPPLGMFLLHGLNQLIKSREIIVFFASSVCLVLSLIYLYLTAELYLSKHQAVAATLLSSLSYYFVLNFALQYNQNTIMLPFWVASVYYFLLAARQNKAWQWVLLGISCALAILAKYQRVLIISLEFLYLIIYFRRSYLRGLFIAFATFLVLLTPHFLWLQQEHFKTFSYASSFIGDATDYKKLTEVFSALFLQPLNLALCFVFFRLIARKDLPLKFKTNMKTFVRHPLGFFAIAPWISFALIACVVQVKAEWGFSMVIFWLPALFYAFDPRVDTLKPWLLLVCLTHLLILLGYLSFTYLDGKTHRNNWPSYPLAQKSLTFWHSFQKPKLKYIGGEEFPAYHLTAYYPGKPLLIKDNDFNLSGWIKKGDFLKHGGIFIDNGCHNHTKKYLRLGFNVKGTRCIRVPQQNKHHPKMLRYQLFFIAPSR